MIPGAAFQPADPTKPYGAQAGQRPSGSTPVQEAIKVLSLRLPKVVGSRPVAPAPLLSSQGSGGNSRVDSIVQQVLSQMFGGGQSAPASMSPQPESSMPAAPSFSGQGQTGYQPQTKQDDFAENFNRTKPRVIVDVPEWRGDSVGGSGDFVVGADGRPMGPNAFPPSQPKPYQPPYDLPSTPAPPFELI